MSCELSGAELDRDLTSHELLSNAHAKEIKCLLFRRLLFQGDARKTEKVRSV